MPNISLNPAYRAQPFQGWGTTLAWFAHGTGQLADPVRNELLDLVFGEHGLRLNIARYNIGGGHAGDVADYLRPGGAVPGWWRLPQGAPSTHAEREEARCVWDANDPNSYDEGADPGQRWWVANARDRVTRWEAFSNSAPYFMTVNGYVSGPHTLTDTQLHPEAVDQFAQYLVHVATTLATREGITVHTLDPMNEPDGPWVTEMPDGQPSARQEGMRLDAPQQAALIEATARALANAGSPITLSTPDASGPELLLEAFDRWPASTREVIGQVNTHTYEPQGSVELSDLTATTGVPLSMSEVDGSWDCERFDPDNFRNALGFASKIVADLRALQPRSWVIWQAIEDLRNLAEVEPPAGSGWGTILTDLGAAPGASPEIRLTQKYFAWRTFTHAIRPGDRQIGSDDVGSVAFINEAEQRLSLVHVNPTDSPAELTVDLSGFTVQDGAALSVRSTRAGGDASAALVPQSVLHTQSISGPSTRVTVSPGSISSIVVHGVSADRGSWVQAGSRLRLHGPDGVLALSDEARRGSNDPRGAVGDVFTVVPAGHGYHLVTADGLVLTNAEQQVGLAPESAHAGQVWSIRSLDGVRARIISHADHRALIATPGLPILAAGTGSEAEQWAVEFITTDVTHATDNEDPS